MGGARWAAAGTVGQLLTQMLPRMPAKLTCPYGTKASLAEGAKGLITSPRLSQMGKADKAKVGTSVCTHMGRRQSCGQRYRDPGQAVLPMSTQWTLGHPADVHYVDIGTSRDGWPARGRAPSVKDRLPHMGAICCYA